MAEIKFCKDCKHIRPSSNHEFSECSVLDVHETDYVSGERVLVSIKYCDRTRMRNGDCKPEGMLFEPKPRPWYAFWRAA